MMDGTNGTMQLQLGHEEDLCCLGEIGKQNGSTTDLQGDR